MLYLVVFLVSAVLTAALFLIKIKIAVEYVRNEDDDNIVLSFYTLKGVFKYKYEIPLIDVGQKNIKFKLVRELGKKEKRVAEKREKLKLTGIFDKYIKGRVFYEENRILLCNIREYLHNRLVFDEFDLNIREGTGNACYTGIFCGLLWSLAGAVTSFLSNNFKTLKKCVSIRPCFEAKVFTVDFLCIFHAKLVHIIVVLMKIYISKYKMKQKVRNEIGGGVSG